MKLFRPNILINVTISIFKVSISHFKMVMYLALCPLESTSLNSSNLLKQLAILFADFTSRNKGYQDHQLRKTFSYFFLKYYNLVSKFLVGLKSFLCQALLGPEFYGD